MSRIGFAISLHMFLVVLIIYHLIFYSNQPNSFLSQTSNIRGIVSHVSVSALIGIRGFQEMRTLTIFGYSSPKALVVLENDILPQSSHANSSGFFEIADASIPIHQKEICLSSYDSFGRLTTPVCFPLSDYAIDKDQRIGPVLLAPTISANRGNYYIGDESVISGQTIPNTNVYISIYPDTKPHISLVSETYAFSLPELSTTSDKQGNYSVSLPTNHSSEYRIFIRTKFNNDFTPKSNTLFLRVYPLWMYFITILRLLLSSLTRYIIEILLLAEVLFFVNMLVRHYFNPYRIAHSRAIVVYRQLLPIQEQLLPIKRKQILPSIYSN